MRFILGIPDISPFSEGEKHQWQKHINPPGIVKGVVLGVALAILIDLFFIPATKVDGFDFKIINSFYIFFLVLIIHEFLHFITLPNPRNAIIGVSLKKFVFYVSTTEVLSKNRLLSVTITPFVLLTLLPFFLLFVFDSHILAYIIIYNAIGSGVDILSFFYFLRQPNDKEYRFVGMDLCSKT